MRTTRAVWMAMTAGVLGAASSHAANPAFQAYFFTVCGTANTGALAARCAQTPGGLGNLSGDSESSLVPTQNLSHGQSPLNLAQARGKELRERDETLRDEPGAASAKVDIGPFSLLAHANTNTFERTSSNDLERTFDGDSRAFELGFDYRASARSVLGLIAGASKTEYDFAAENAGVNFAPQRRAGDSSSDSLYMSGFAAFSLGEAGFIDLALGYERSDRTLRRSPVFQESTRSIAQTAVEVQGDTDAKTTWASVNGGFDVGHGAFSAGVYAGATFAKSELGAYTERDLNGSGLAMSFGDASRQSLRAHAGMRGSYTFGTAHGVVVPQVRLEYTHELEDDVSRLNARFVLDPEASVFAASGDERDIGTLQAGCGISAILANGWQPFVNLDFSPGHEQFDRTRVTLGVRVEL